MTATFGTHIRNARRARKFGLVDFAARVGVATAYLERIEQGAKNAPSEEVIERIADGLGEDFDGLMFLAGRIPLDIEEILRRDLGLWSMIRSIGRALDAGHRYEISVNFFAPDSTGGSR